MRVRYLLPALALVVANLASAALIDRTSYSWTGSEATMPTRLFRDGVPSTFDAPKAFPGTFGSTNGYVGFTYSWAQLGGDDHVTINVIGSTVESHLIAYAGSFNPLDLSANYLGDQGLSGVSLFGIILPSGSDLVVVAQTNSGLERAIGLGFTFDVTTPGSQVPEPATAALLAAGLAAAALARRRRA